MRKFLLGTAALIALGVPAMAADMGVRPIARPAPYYTWTGCYLGVNIGYETGGSKVYSPPGAISGTAAGAPIPAPIGDITPQFKLGGIMGGGTAGCQYQWNTYGWGTWVIGIEGDGGPVDKEGQANDLPPSFNGAFVNQTNERWLVTVRGRLGYAVDKWLFYATGGGAWAGVEETAWATCPAAGCPDGGSIATAGVPTAHDKKTMFGYAVGGGVEYALGYGWSIKSEYIFVRFTDKDFFNPPTSFTPNQFVVVNPNRVSLYDHTFKWGLNYKFDLGYWGKAAPAVATKG